MFSLKVCIPNIPLQLVLPCSMASFSVVGRVKLQGNKATLTLNFPEVKPEPEVRMSRPTTETILTKIDAGTIHVHPTRQPLTKKMLTNAMCNVQRMLLLPGGANGGWSQQAQERLVQLLAKPLVSKPSKPLPIEDAAPLSIEDEKQDANDSSSVGIKDEKQDADDSSSESSSDSDSSSDVPMKTEVEKAMKYKDDQIAKAKEDFESIFSALHACQGQLEDANKKIETQEVEIARLKRLLEECCAAAPSDDEDSDAEMGSDSE